MFCGKVTGKWIDKINTTQLWSRWLLVDDPVGKNVFTSSLYIVDIHGRRKRGGRGGLGRPNNLHQKKKKERKEKKREERIWGESRSKELFNWLEIHLEAGARKFVTAPSDSKRERGGEVKGGGVKFREGPTTLYLPYLRPRKKKTLFYGPDRPLFPHFF